MLYWLRIYFVLKTASVKALLWANTAIAHTESQHTWVLPDERSSNRTLILLTGNYMYTQTVQVHIHVHIKLTFSLAIESTASRAIALLAFDNTCTSVWVRHPAKYSITLFWMRINLKDAKFCIEIQIVTKQKTIGQCRTYHWMTWIWYTEQLMIDWLHFHLTTGLLMPPYRQHHWPCYIVGNHYST